MRTCTLRLHTSVSCCFLLVEFCKCCLSMQIRVSQFSQLLHDLCQAIIAQDISTIAQHYFIVPKNADHRRSGGFCDLCMSPIHQCCPSLMSQLCCSLPKCPINCDYWITVQRFVLICDDHPPSSPSSWPLPHAQGKGSGSQGSAAYSRQLSSESPTSSQLDSGGGVSGRVLPPGWQCRYTSDGTPYYINCETKNVSWEWPGGRGLVQV